MHLSRSTRLLSVAALAVVLSPFAAAQGDNSFPPPYYPDENQPNAAQEVLGKLLFWEEQLSFANSMACGTCHIHEAGGSDPRSFNTVNPGPDGLFDTADDIHGSQGVVRMDHDGNFQGDTLFGHGFQVTGRKSPPAINAFAFNDIFWDGRAKSTFISVDTGEVAEVFFGGLESQAAGPPLSDVEMTRESHTWDDIESKLATVKPMALATNLPAAMQDFIAQYPTYPEMFEAAYGDPTITGDRIVMAIGNYERLLFSNQTPVDEWLATGIIAPDLEPGLTLFTGKASCSACHVLPQLANDNFHNIGVRPDEEDVGRMAVTGDPLDMAKFKTPGLRNVALRLPLFHNGGKNTLAEVVEFYDKGSDFPGPNLDVQLLPLNLTEQEKADLVHFLDAGLTDLRVVNNLSPFDRPTLRTELPPLNTVYGIASNNGLGSPPKVIAHLPANKGNPNWLMGVADSTANSPALLALAFGSDDGSPLPDPRYPIPMNIDVSTIFTLEAVSTDGMGWGTIKLGIPNSPALTGLTFYGQWFVQDAGALSTGGVYGSEGIEVEIL